MEPDNRHEPSLASKVAIIAIQIGLIAMAQEILLGPLGERASTAMHWMAPADLGRRHLLMVLNLVIAARVAFMLFVLHKRRVAPREVVRLSVAFGVYYVGFALLALRSATAMGKFGYIGIVIFGLGSLLNSGAELERYLWKRAPGHEGHLFTGGLFSWSRHINYFGDLIWVTGYALITGNHTALLVPVALFAYFAVYRAPHLDRHLATHYGPEYYHYARTTKTLVPWLF